MPLALLNDGGGRKMGLFKQQKTQLTNLVKSTVSIPPTSHAASRSDQYLQGPWEIK